MQCRIESIFQGEVREREREREKKERERESVCVTNIERKGEELV